MPPRLATSSQPAPGREPIAPGLLRRMTVRRVLDVLRADGPSTRADLVRATGISAPTISKAIASLLDSGVVEETDPAATASAGRPARRLRLATRSARVVGLVIDADRLEAGAAGLDGRILPETWVSTPAPRGYRELLDAAVELLAPLVGSEGVLGVGISSPGLTDHREQRVILSPNLPATNGRQPALDLSRALGVPCRLAQESHALCLAERMVGAARELDDFVVLDATAGLGAGIYQAGRLVQGARGLAGEIGHVTFDPDGQLCGCGNRGCLETLATDRALAQRVSRVAGEPLDPAAALDRISAAPDRYRAAIEATERWLAIAIAAVANVFNPDAVFVHANWPRRVEGGFARVVDSARARLIDPDRDACRIEPSAVDKLDGAIAAALHSFLMTPEPRR